MAGSNARLVASISMPEPSSPAVPLTMRRDSLRAWSRMFSECSLPLAWMVIFLVAVPMAMVSSSQSSALLFCRGLLMSVPSNQMMDSGWSFASVVMRVFCSFVWNECGAARKARHPVAGENLQSWPVTLRRGIGLCGRLVDPVPAGHGPGSGPAGAPSTGQAGGASTWTVHCRMTRG